MTCRLAKAGTVVAFARVIYKRQIREMDFRPQGLFGGLSQGLRKTVLFARLYGEPISRGLRAVENASPRILDQLTAREQFSVGREWDEAFRATVDVLMMSG